MISTHPREAMTMAYCGNLNEVSVFKSTMKYFVETLLNFKPGICSPFSIYAKEPYQVGL